MPRTWWTTARTKAAQHIFDDALSDEQIAEAVGKSRKWLSEQKKRPEFVQRLEELAAHAAAQLASEGIRSRENQLRRLQVRAYALDEIVRQRSVGKPPSARSAELKVADVYGWDTGYLVHDVKTNKDSVFDVYSLDTGLLGELRAIEKQAAQVKGWWVDKAELAGRDGAPISVIVQRGGPALGV